VQRPIRLDSTWLRVGHVDEMLSFVQGGDGNYRALLMSPRLAYIMLRGVASSRVFADAGELITWATGANDLCIADGIYTEDRLDHHLAGLAPNVPEPLPAVTQPVSFHAVAAYNATPVVPAGSDRFVVARLDGPAFGEY